MIISSKELQMSSDDSSTTSTIDVSIESAVPVNPWGDMDVKDIPIEIIDHFSNSEDSVQVYDSTPKTQVIFKPLTDDDRQIAALKFNLVITGKTHPVKFTGIDKMCPYPPVITQAAKLNGTCLFNSFSMLLAGRHIQCNNSSHCV